MGPALITLAAVIAWGALCRVSPAVTRRTLNVLIGLDQLAWVLLTLGHGSPDETISAALWRMERKGRIAGRVLRPVVDVMFLPFERDHCQKAFEAEATKAHLPDAYKGDKHA